MTKQSTKSERIAKQKELKQERAERIRKRRAEFAPITHAVGVYKRCKTRSSRMRQHWKIAREVQSYTGQSIGDSRRIASALAYGAEFAGENATTDYRYIWRVRIFADDEHVRDINISIISGMPLGVREQGKRVMALMKAQAEKKQYQGNEYNRSEMEQEKVFIRGKNFGLKLKPGEVIKDGKIEKRERTDKERHLGVLLEEAEAAERKAAGLTAQIRAQIAAEK